VLSATSECASGTDLTASVDEVDGMVPSATSESASVTDPIASMDEVDGVVPSATAECVRGTVGTDDVDGSNSTINGRIGMGRCVVSDGSNASGGIAFLFSGQMAVKENPLAAFCRVAAP